MMKEVIALNDKFIADFSMEKHWFPKYIDG
jgi:hypothetical protein